MSITSRLSDYGIVGAFFIFLHFIVYSLPAVIIISAYQEETKSIIFEIKNISDEVPDIFRPAAAGVLAVLSILFIFMFGVIVEVLNFVLSPFELKVLSTHLAHNKNWLSRFVEKYHEYIAKDYNHIINFSDYVTVFDFSLITKQIRHLRERKFSYLVGINYALSLEGLPRVQDFLLSYLFEFSHAKDYIVFTDKIRVWNFWRNFTTAMMIVCIEVFVICFVLIYFEIGVGMFFIPLLISLLMLVLVFFSIKITKIAYSKVCLTLFSLIYICLHKLEND